MAEVKGKDMVLKLIEKYMMMRSFEEVPKEHLGEFLKKQMNFTRSRVYLFCVLAVGIYVFAVTVGMLLNPEEFKVLEVLVGLILGAGCALVLYLNKRAASLRSAKLNAYLLTALLLALMVRLGLGYADDPVVSSSIFVFTLFMIAITIPWSPLELVPVWVMHIAAFTASFLGVKYLPGVPAGVFSMTEYLDGVIFMSISFWICLVVRRKDTARDIENFILFKNIEDKNRQMSKELEWATRIHKTIIPDSITGDKVDIGVTYLPIYYIGGDYARFDFLDKDKLLFIIGDVTGHGVSAALLVNRVHAEFERLGKEGKSPGELLKELNEFIKGDFGDSDMFLSAFCGLMDFKAMKLSYSNYGHPPQYLYRRKDSSVKGLMPQTSLLGLPLDDDEVYEEALEIGTKDKLVLFTDGITEVIGSSGKEYGEKGVEDFLKKNYALSAKSFNAKLMEELNAFKKDAFQDDICMMTIGVEAHESLYSIGSHFLRQRDHKTG